MRPLPTRPTILCVDDEPHVLAVLSKMFERMARVLTASSAEAGLEVLRAHRVDLLLTDQKMVGMTGIELAAAARAEGHDVTTILLTGYTNPADLIAAINEGRVFRYVSKPWELNDLTMTVRNALAYVELRREKERLLETLHKRVEALKVMYEVSRHSDHASSLDAIVDRLLATVGRVLPHDVSAVLVDTADGARPSLRIRCTTAVTEQALLHVKDSMLAAQRNATPSSLAEDRLVTNVSGPATPRSEALSAFASALSVPLISLGQPVGTLALFAARAAAYSPDDGELLDLLVNQTTEAIGHVRAVERDARLRMEQMVEAMAEGVVLTDEKGAVVVVNAAARTLLGLPKDEPVALERLTERLGFSPFDMVRGWQYGGQKVISEDLRLHERDVHLVVSPVVGRVNALRGVMLVLRDVTEQKLLAQRKNEFMGVISHELRTPLTSITGALDLVLNNLAGDINDKQRRFLDMARESTEKLNALVDDLLDLTRFDQGSLRMAFEVTHLGELVRLGVERYGPAFQERRIEVALEGADLGVRLLADPNRLTQVINNLLTNAVKFTPAGGQVKVAVGRAGGAPAACVVSVWNSGDSIADGDLERIFDRFEQARTEKNRTVPGTGLGLSICRAIVQAHGGRMWAEPEPGGARFVVVLPEQPPERPLAPDEQPANDGARGCLLVIEDDPRLAWAMKSALIVAGYRVVLAHTGEEALAQARRHRPAVICLDQGLPDIEGLKLLEIFRHDPETTGSRVLMISGHAVRDEAMRGGAAAFLQKPLATAALLSAVEALIRDTRSGRGRIVVVDDDPQISAICAEVLANQGFEVERAGTLAEARALIARIRPELILLDVALPDGDGFHFFEELKAERGAAPLSVIFISARGDTAAKVRALKLGGDDYLTKPFDALELGARVESVLRRRSAEAQASPTTLLPGSAAIEREVQRRLAAHQPFAFCYLDLDNLKAFNDYYGFAKADGVVRQTADLLREVVAEVGDGSEFVGHVAGDDFVFITAPDRVDVVCGRMIQSFDRIIPLYYDRVDRERGSIEAEDRFGERRRFPIMSVSIVAVMADGRAEHPELARQAAELKKRAKAMAGSVFLRSDQSANRLSTV